MNRKQEILFSLIVPVYNGGEYLRRCVKSLLEQTIKNFEIIIVDDGSTDLETQEIENDFANDYHEIKLISQNNQGTSIARNVGICQATGRYITFLDQDDYWSKNDTLEKIESIINSSKPDLIFSNFFRAKNGKIKKRSCHVREDELKNIQSKDERIEYLIQKNGIGRTVWSVFFKKAFLKNNRIQFPPHARYEDFDFLASCLEKDCLIDWFSPPYYVYNLGLETQQTSQKVSKEMCADLEKSILRHLPSCKNHPGFQSYLSFLQFVLLCEEIKILGLKNVCKQYSKTPKEQVFFQRLKEFPYSLFGLVYRLFGLRPMIYFIFLALSFQEGVVSFLGRKTMSRHGVL